MGARGGAGGVAAALWLAAGLAAAQEPEPFAVESLRVEGRVIQLRSADLGGRADGAGRALVVASVSGSPPDEVRRLSVFAPGPAGRLGPGPGPARVLTLPPQVVAFDVGPAEAHPGDAIALLDADGLELHALLAEDRPLRRLPLSRLPLPARTRDVSRLPMLGSWGASGDSFALVPTLDGARLVRLADATARSLPLPLVTEYWTAGWETPPQYGFLRTAVDWPVLARGDDDGDGHPDLFALARFGVQVFRGEPEGLSGTPHRRMPLRPFTPEEELRFQATGLEMLARDVDGDGHTDLVVHANAGTLLASRSRTAIYRNPGDGVRLAGGPTWQVELDTLSAPALLDLDADGRSELVLGVLRFGVVQVVRVLATRTARVEIRVLALPDAPDAPARETWSTEIPLALDFAKGRVDGLLPTGDGDWNGDGRRDLLFGVDARTLELRLASAGESDPGFDGPTARQSVPGSSLGLVADFGGDGLDDLALYDPRDPAGHVHVLHNRGRLPGTPAPPPALRAPPGEGADAAP